MCTSFKIAIFEANAIIAEDMRAILLDLVDAEITVFHSVPIDTHETLGTFDWCFVDISDPSLTGVIDTIKRRFDPKLVVTTTTSEEISRMSPVQISVDQIFLKPFSETKLTTYLQSVLSSPKKSSPQMMTNTKSQMIYSQRALM